MKTSIQNKFWLSLGAAALTLAEACPSAQASSLAVGVSGIASQGLLGTNANTVLTFNVGAGTHITGLSWDVALQAMDPSWLSEMRVSFSGSDASGPGVMFAPGEGADHSGTANFSGHSAWAAQGMDFAVGADGLLRLEFSELAWDGLAPDGIWKSGHLNLELAAAVPEPANYVLLSLGLMAVLGATRRKIRPN